MQPSQIARALSLASEGEIVFPRELTAALINQEDQPPDLQALTPRQREILGLVARGLTNAGIGRELYLTEGTVKQHLRDRKSTRLNSSHANISYAVFCLKKKK